jgi:hypothetical protein
MYWTYLFLTALRAAIVPKVDVVREVYFQSIQYLLKYPHILSCSGYSSPLYHIMALNSAAQPEPLTLLSRKQARKSQ